MTGRLGVAWDAGPGHERLLACEVIGGGRRITRTLDADAPYAFDVPEGTYVVRVALPSGAFMSSVAEVAGDRETWVVLGDSTGAVTEVPDPGAESFTPGTGGADRRPTRPLFARLWLGDTPSTWSDTVEVAPDGAITARLSTGLGPYALQVGGPETAWRTVRLPPAYGVTLTVSRSEDTAGFDDGVHVGVTSASPVAGSLLGYLASGQLDAAQIVAPELVRQAEELFRGKMANPEGAAAAGYFLLRAGQQESVRNWPENFANWFDWLPDAAVIHAWQLLRRPRVPERDVARARLLQAARAGAPCYTEGLRLLFQGLQLLGNEDPDDADVAGALEQVRLFAAACDWDAVHTTYWSARPDRPGLQRHTGWPTEADGWVRLPGA